MIVLVVPAMAQAWSALLLLLLLSLFCQCFHRSCFFKVVTTTTIDQNDIKLTHSFL